MITLYLQSCPRFDGFDRVYFTKREGKGAAHYSQGNGVLGEGGSCIGGGDGLCFSAEGFQLDTDILCEGHFGIYRTKEAIRDYIMGYIRMYAGDDVNPQGKRRGLLDV
jgi:hypothetical protein